MGRTRNSDTDTQDAAQETIATIVAQGRTKKASTQKMRGKSTKGVQVPQVEQEEGVEHDDPVPQDPVPPPTAAPAQATISPEVGQMFNVVNSAMEMFKAFMANQNERRDEIPPQSNRQNNSESSRKALRVMKAFDDEVVELAAYQLRDVVGAWLAKHAPHMVKSERAKIRRFVGGLAYHIKDTTSAAAVGMTVFSSVVGFAKHLEKDRQ
ncbi:PREDICTED: uncharacterized protein LOC109211209 [Nicotiana attenuata]|uniref:uncharacterized protein LOC109211209 n=1 Tax=Nicotiana attenuata TaxID=49451 RepID=UPI000904CF3D|nr:PREDICTED: uncharacterized protein LOC109211209 [Nicotiana attenuata]